MIVNKYTKLYQDRIGCKTNWLNNDDWVYVETISELGKKIATYSPCIDLVFDGNGNLIDVEITGDPSTPTEAEEQNELNSDEVLLDHEYRITMLELGI